MDIKKYAVGQTAYILGDGRSRKPTTGYTEAVVTKVGRIYVTVKCPGNWTIMFGDRGAHEPYLVEKVDYGAPRMLFHSKQAVEEYRERGELEKELGVRFDFSHIRYIPLDKLRAVKEILNGEEAQI